MATLIVRNVDEAIVRALKSQAGARGISAEAEHRRILEEALSLPVPRRFEQVLAEMPNVGRDEDFVRSGNEAPRHVPN